MKLEPKVINNETYAIITKLRYVVSIPNGRIWVQFGRDEALSDLLTQIINQNYSILVKELSPYISSTFAKICKKIANGFMSKFTEKQLFP